MKDICIWLRYFLVGVRWSAERASRQARELVDLRETMRRQLLGSPKALQLLDALFVNPNINASRVKELLNVTDPTARAALGELESAGLIQETTGRSWGRQYLARGVLKAIEMPQGGDEG